MKSKLLYAQEWVKAKPMIDSRFGKGADPRCEVCGKASCATAWYSIKTQRFRCFRCFTPE